MYDVKQFRLSSGEEVIAEVLEWPDNTSPDLIIRNAVSLLRYEDSNGSKFYGFKTWIHFAEEPDSLTVMSPDHIIATTNPHELLVSQYRSSLQEIIESASIRNKQLKMEELEISKLIGDKLKNFLLNETGYDNDGDDGYSMDSGVSNIIKFPPIH